MCLCGQAVLLLDHFFGSFQHPGSGILVYVFGVLIEGLFYGIVESGRLRKFHENSVAIDGD